MAIAMWRGVAGLPASAFMGWLEGPPIEWAGRAANRRKWRNCVTPRLDITTERLERRLRQCVP
jgi:hypothetical protein